MQNTRKNMGNKTICFSNDNLSLFITQYLKNDFTGYSRRFFVGTPAAEQEEQQEEHKDMPRYTLISRCVASRTHARTKRNDFPVGVRKRNNPPNVRSEFFACISEEGGGGEDKSHKTKFINSVHSLHHFLF